MKDHVLVSVRLLVVFTILLGFGYPAVVWAVGRVAFPRAAGGSFVTHGGKVVGSELIGQAVTSPGLFRTRPSAAGAGYDAAASAGRQQTANGTSTFLTEIDARAHGVVGRDHLPLPILLPWRISPDSAISRSRIMLFSAAPRSTTTKQFDC